MFVHIKRYVDDIYILSCHSSQQLHLLYIPNCNNFYYKHVRHIIKQIPTRVRKSLYSQKIPKVANRFQWYFFAHSRFAHSCLTRYTSGAGTGTACLILPKVQAPLDSILFSCKHSNKKGSNSTPTTLYALPGGVKCLPLTIAT